MVRQNICVKKLLLTQLLEELSPWGGTLKCLYIRRLGLFFGFNILNFNIFGGFQKNEYFLGYEDFVDIFLGSPQNWPIFRVISIHFRVFYIGQSTEWGILFPRGGGGGGYSDIFIHT